MDYAFEEDVIKVSMIYLLMEKHLRKSTPCYNSRRRGSDLINELLNHNNPRRCQNMFRLNPDLFRRLCATLQEYGLVRSRGVAIDEKVGIFMFIVGHGATTRVVQEMFQHSSETVFRHFNDVLTAVVELSKNIIKPAHPDFPNIPSHIRQSDKYFPFFKDCIGAMDGTHIAAHVPTNDRIINTNRKGEVTQNVLCVCDFDYRFTFVAAGADGQSHDANVLSRVLGKYYLVDSGFPNKSGFLAPYKGERYHGSEFRQGYPPRNPKELFNYTHSSLRNIIERTFAIWKNRFRILYSMPNYKMSKQIKIVLATAALHNYILMNDGDDPYVNDFFSSEEAAGTNCSMVNEAYGSSSATNSSGHRWMNGVRDSIAADLSARPPTT